MEERRESNSDLEELGVFSAANNYLLLFFALACLLSSFFLQSFFFAIDRARLGVIVADGVGILLPLFLLLRKFPPGVAYQLKLKGPRGLLTLRVLLATGAMIVVTDFVYMITLKYLSPPPEYLDALLSFKPTGFLSFLVSFAAVCLIVPLAEEVLFRGFVQQIFARNMNEALAFVLAGLLFGVVHLDPHLLLSISFYGIFLSYLFYATGNLIYPVLSHAFFNSLSLIQLAYSTQDNILEPPFYARNAWIPVASLVMLLFFLREIRREARE